MTMYATPMLPITIAAASATHSTVVTPLSDHSSLRRLRFILARIMDCPRYTRPAIRKSAASTQKGAAFALESQPLCQADT